ncbi:ABC transporter ATP-binding protein [Fodinibius sp.]|uniref:ABC transporter ATP-binding protein n=1 Tax=Fodinibius sp. TaxID=1872440 RepID=UPI00356B3971
MNKRAQQSPILQFNDVTAYRNDTKVMDHFSMTIHRQEHTAIVGPNGSGKSTFIQLLTHQLHPLAPEGDTPPIRVFGKDRWIVSELRKRIGIISADLEGEIMHNLNHGRLSGSEVVLTGFFSSMQLFGHHRITDAMKQQADRTLASMDAAYLKDRRFNRMSAGEARRVLIARALVTSPEVLVLDEPTTALDLVARERCLQHIRNIARRGTTVIIVTHHLEEVLPEITNVILLKEGRAAFSGPKKKVLTSEKLSSVYDHPLELYFRNGTPRIELNIS